MSATIRAAIELERIGDYAVSIARVATRLSVPPDQHLARAVENMAQESGEMLERAVQAFADGNAEQAPDDQREQREQGALGATRKPQRDQSCHQRAHRARQRHKRQK